MLAETIEGKYGIKGEIHYDEEPSYADPRDNDNLGVMYCWHPNYVLGDEQFGRGDHASMEDVVRYLWRERKAIVIIPLFLLDHSGISIRCGSALAKDHSTLRDLQATDRFIGDYAGWDTSHVGFIYATQKRLDYFGVTDIEGVEQQLRDEVDEYDIFLRGEVFYYTVEDADGETVDSCCGFLGTKHVEEEAKSAIEQAERAHEREISERQFWNEREVVTVG